MNGLVVVDASLAAMWAVPEPYSEAAVSLADRWVHEGTRLFAPCLMLAEVNNALYKRIVRGEMSLATAQAALDAVLRFSVEIREEPGLRARAMQLARQFRRPTTYDCQYLVLAELLDCELWTGDQRFYNAVRRAFPKVKWVGQHRERAPR